MSDMELLVNDCSLHGQFDDYSTFRKAIYRMIHIRKMVREFDRQLHCLRNLAGSRITNNLRMREVIGKWLGPDERRIVLAWLDKDGPFWDDERDHDSDEFMECNGEVVTDTAVGEAAHRCLNEKDYRLVSFSPSDWEYSPVSVKWTLGAGEVENVDVCNYWEIDPLKSALQSASSKLRTWEGLRTFSIDRFSRLTFSNDSFEPLRGAPFKRSAADHIIDIFDVLERLKSDVDERGKWTPEASELHRKHFTGSKPWFSDSSRKEKNSFKSELTFRHPTKKDVELFCPWHGKIKSPQYRVHFSWPVSHDEPLFVVYVGDKLTKK